MTLVPLNWHPICCQCMRMVLKFQDRSCQHTRTFNSSYMLFLYKCLVLFFLVLVLPVFVLVLVLPVLVLLALLLVFVLLVPVFVPAHVFPLVSLLGNSMNSDISRVLVMHEINNSPVPGMVDVIDTIDTETISGMYLKSQVPCIMNMSCYSLLVRAPALAQGITSTKVTMRTCTFSWDIKLTS